MWWMIGVGFIAAVVISVTLIIIAFA